MLSILRTNSQESSTSLTSEILSKYKEKAENLKPTSISAINTLARFIFAALALGPCIALLGPAALVDLTNKARTYKTVSKIEPNRVTKLLTNKKSQAILTALAFVGLTYANKETTGTLIKQVIDLAKNTSNTPEQGFPLIKSGIAILSSLGIYSIKPTLLETFQRSKPEPSQPSQPSQNDRAREVSDIVDNAATEAGKESARPDSSSLKANLQSTLNLSPDQPRRVRSGSFSTASSATSRAKTEPQGMIKSRSLPMLTGAATDLVPLPPAPISAGDTMPNSEAADSSSLQANLPLTLNLGPDQPRRVRSGSLSITSSATGGVKTEPQGMIKSRSQPKLTGATTDLVPLPPAPISAGDTMPNSEAAGSSSSQANTSQSPSIQKIAASTATAEPQLLATSSQSLEDTFNSLIASFDDISLDADDDDDADFIEFKSSLTQVKYNIKTLKSKIELLKLQENEIREKEIKKLQSKIVYELQNAIKFLLVQSNNLLDENDYDNLKLTLKKITEIRTALAKFCEEIEFDSKHDRNERLYLSFSENHEKTQAIIESSLEVEDYNKASYAYLIAAEYLKNMADLVERIEQIQTPREELLANAFNYQLEGIINKFKHAKELFEVKNYLDSNKIINQADELTEEIAKSYETTDQIDKAHEIYKTTAKQYEFLSNLYIEISKKRTEKRKKLLEKAAEFYERAGMKEEAERCRVPIMSRM